MKTIADIVKQIQNSKELQKKLSEAAKNNSLMDFMKEMGFDGTSEEFTAPAKLRDGELSDGDLGDVNGGVDGYNPGWAYGPCRKCPGTRYVMQLDYRNIIACPSCGDWVEF